MALFERVWDVIKDAERRGELTVEEALDVATRAPQALFCSMMESLKDNGEDPRLLLVQVTRLHQVMQTRLTQIAEALCVAPKSGVH